MHRLSEIKTLTELNDFARTNLFRLLKKHADRNRTPEDALLVDRFQKKYM